MTTTVAEAWPTPHPCVQFTTDGHGLRRCFPTAEEAFAAVAGEWPFECTRISAEYCSIRHDPPTAAQSRRTPTTPTP